MSAALAPPRKRRRPGDEESLRTHSGSGSSTHRTEKSSSRNGPASQVIVIEDSPPLESSGSKHSKTTALDYRNSVSHYPYTHLLGNGHIGGSSSAVIANGYPSNSLSSSYDGYPSASTRSKRRRTPITQALPIAHHPAGSTSQVSGAPVMGSSSYSSYSSIPYYASHTTYVPPAPPRSYSSLHSTYPYPHPAQPSPPMSTSYTSANHLGDYNTTLGVTPTSAAGSSKRRKREYVAPPDIPSYTRYQPNYSSHQYGETKYHAPVDSVKSTIPPPYDDKEGHYIIKPYDQITSRYKIERLLGQGTFGKVVQCYDKEDRCYVAIKIIRAIPKYRDASKIEIRVLNTLRENDPHNLNKCIHMRECFDFRNHVCIVSELLGMSVFDFLKENNFYPFPPSHIQDFARQLLKSVAFLHELRLVHTDLKPENILLVENGYSLGVSRRASNKTNRILDSTDIRLIDFGSATFEDEYHSSVVSTRHYRAPEIILGMGWSYPCDIWSIGCILVEFFTGQALFQTHDNLEHLAMMQVVIGRLPDRFVRQALKTPSAKYFRNGRLDYPNAETQRGSRKYVKAMKILSEIVPPVNEANESFLDLLGGLLTYDPVDRLTAKEALRHGYFTTRIYDEGSATAFGCVGSGRPR